MFNDATKNRVARWIAGDISIAKIPGDSLRRWREKFGIKQNTLADKLDISPSVISDYESGRRESPGVGVIKKIVKTLLEIDDERGGQVTQAFAHRFGANLPPEIVLGMREFEKPVNGKKIKKIVDGRVLANEDSLERNIFGYTAIDSPKAILELNTDDLLGLYGLTTERALIFTKVNMGRSPLVAIKVRGITPGIVVLHGNIGKADKLGIKIAEKLKVPLVHSQIPSIDELLERLQNSG
ncbi:MAG: helix-turn-helix domain-containing protein [Candidatus Hadarchaeia archaeon]